MDTTPNNPFEVATPTATTSQPVGTVGRMRDTYDFFGRKVIRDTSAKGQYTNLYIIYVDLHQADGGVTREFLGKLEARSFVQAPAISEVVTRIFGASAQFDRVDLRALTPEAKAILNKLDAYAFQPAWNASAARTAIGNAWANNLAEPEGSPQNGASVLNDAASAGDTK